MSKKMIKPDSFAVGDVWEMLAGDHDDFDSAEKFTVLSVDSDGDAKTTKPYADFVGQFRIDEGEVKLISRIGCTVVDGMIVGEEIEVPEAEVVKEWFSKLDWLVKHTGVNSNSLTVRPENNDGCLYDEYSVDFVINSYESYQKKESEKKKQELLDKKAQLEAELAQINKELGEWNECH